MSKTQRPLPDAERIAAAIVADLAPFCARIQVAGSVRRHKAVVGDIEIVAIPRYAPTGFFGDCTANLLGDCTANLLCEHLHASDSYRVTKGDHAPPAATISSSSPGTRACSAICFWRRRTTGA